MGKLTDLAAVLLVAVGCGDVSLTDSNDGSAFKLTGSLLAPRMDHTATLLLDGRVLIVGGTGAITAGAGNGLSSAELYSPASGSFSATDAMPRPRVGHVAVRLPDGDVLIVGGGTREALIYDVSGGGFRAAGSSVALDEDLVATSMVDGRVYLMSSYSDRPEVYDPAAGVFVRTHQAGTRRFGHTVTAMPDGTVMLIGGGILLAERYDPAGDSFVTIAEMRTARFGHAATVLTDGRVLVTGGSARVSGGPYGPVVSAEIYDPVGRTFTSAGSALVPRYGHASVLLPGGDVLIIGGAEFEAEIYRHGAGTFELIADERGRARQGATATLLNDGRVLVAGGLDEGYRFADRAVLYAP